MAIKPKALPDPCIRRTDLQDSQSIFEKKN